MDLILDMLFNQVLYYDEILWLVSNIISSGDQGLFENCLRGISCMQSKKKFESLPLANILIKVLEQGEYLSFLVLCFEIENIVESLVTSESKQE